VKATSFKLPDDLKKRIQALIAGTGRTAQSFMVEAIAATTERADLRGRSGARATRAEQETLESGMSPDADEVFSYLKARAAGKKPKGLRPKARLRSS
jgi:predicted transcriptional regulator